MSNLIEKKTFDFAVKIINLYKQLIEEKEFIISKQLFRSATSIGANVVEGLKGQSKADFIAKLSIALKESVETEYWLKLLVATNLTKIELNSYLFEINEIISILTKIIKTTKNNNS